MFGQKTSDSLGKPMSEFPVLVYSETPHVYFIAGWANSIRVSVLTFHVPYSAGWAGGAAAAAAPAPVYAAPAPAPAPVYVAPAPAPAPVYAAPAPAPAVYSAPAQSAYSAPAQSGVSVPLFTDIFNHDRTYTRNNQKDNVGHNG